MSSPFTELDQSILASLETYSNVHRGSGHNSMVSTRLFEHAREIILEHLGLSEKNHVVVFCTQRRAEKLTRRLDQASYKSVSSRDIGLPLGVTAVAIDRKKMPERPPFQTGGGTARLVSSDKITWARAPGLFEAGTPAIINTIAFAKALLLAGRNGKGVFNRPPEENCTAADILYRDALEKYSGHELLKELRKSLIGRDVRVPTAEGAQPYCNLDNAASTPAFGPIWEAARRTWRLPRQAQQEVVSEVRSICAKFLGAPEKDYDCLFVSNTTEAINLVAESISAGREGDLEPVILNTLLEHNSNELPWRMISGFSLVRLTIDEEGFVDLSELETVLCAYNRKHLHGKKRIGLVAVSGASNVLGTFNDLSAIGRIAHAYGARLLVDAAQLAAHRKIEMEKSGIDFLAFSGHKVYAPFGSGVLMAKKGLLTFALSEQESIRSSGEENPGGIAALGKALELLQRIGLETVQEEEQALTRRALEGLAKIPGLAIYGIKDHLSPRFARKGGIILFKLKGFMAPKVARELANQGGIGVRSGCHCAHMLIKRELGIPPLLQRFQHLLLFLFPGLSLPGLVRISFGLENDESDVDRLVGILGKIAGKSAAGTSALPESTIRRQMDDFVSAAVRRVYG